MSYRHGEHRDNMPTRLSVWEIAHRWEGENPLHDGVVSLKVLDRLRWLVDRHAEDEVIKARGVGNEYGVTFRHLTNAARSLSEGKIEPEKLKAISILCIDLDFVCTQLDEALPEFWFEVDGASTSPVAVNLTDEQEDRITCQKIAQELWAENSLLRQVDVIRHPRIQLEGNGKLYKEDTLKRWVKEFDRRPKNKRLARPPNKV